MKTDCEFRWHHESLVLIVTWGFFIWEDATMFDFLTPTFFEGLTWTIIIVGGIWAVIRIYRNMSGSPRWPVDDVPHAKQSQSNDSSSKQAPTESD